MERRKAARLNDIASHLFASDADNVDNDGSNECDEFDAKSTKRRGRAKKKRTKKYPNQSGDESTSNSSSS